MIFTTYFFSLLVAIGIEAFNKLKSEEKGKEKVEAGSSPKTSRQEDEVSTVSKLPSVQNVCKVIIIFHITFIAILVTSKKPVAVTYKNKICR